MKKKSLLLLAMAFVGMGIWNEMYSDKAGAPAARSGGPLESTCATSSCHSGTLNSGPGVLEVTSDAPGNMYSLGQTYTITVTITQSGIQRFGFETLSGYSPTSNGSTGTTALSQATRTQLKSSGAKRYVTHRSTGIDSTDHITWSFHWTAPATPGTGDVYFYTAGNATNKNNGRSGDLVYTTFLMLTEEPLAAATPEISNQLTLGQNPVLSDFAFLLENATGQVLKVQVLDLNGKGLLQQSIQTAQGAAQGVMDFNSLASGVYVAQFSCGDWAKSIRVVKQ